MQPGCTRGFGALLLLFQLDLVDHVTTPVVVGQAERFPPVRQHHVQFAVFSAQPHEVKGRPKARLLDQAKRRTAHALLETRLHQPDFTHVTGQLATARHVANAGTEHVLDGVLQGRVGMLLRPDARGPAVAHIGPQHAGEQKAGGYRFALADPAIGVLQCGFDKG
ncbi:MAG: hypothetical protein ACD_23C01268G0002 [uncultured bacterium]|nr:MAG: hypothetical protein ACD_23C01268G0002 [uncultured bacterium]